MGKTDRQVPITKRSGRCLWGSCKTHVDGGWYCKQHRDPGEREAKSRRVETARTWVPWLD